MKKILDTTKCEYCGNLEAIAILTHHDNNYFVDEIKFKLGRCVNCGLVRVLNPPSHEKIGNYYPKSEYYAYATKKSVPFEIKRHYYKLVSIIPGFLKRKLAFNDLYFIPESTNEAVLDVGCGDGSGLMLLGDLGYARLFGTEIAESSCKEISKMGIRMYCGSDLSKIPIKEKFNAIRLNHSLEHVYNPSKTIGTARKLLVDEGLLYVAVPNFNSIASRIFRNYFCGLQLPTHLYHFDKNTLSEIIESNGFEIIKIKTVGLSGISYSLKTFFKDRYKISIGELAFLPVLLLMIPLEVILNMIGQGFMINLAARKVNR